MSKHEEAPTVQAQGQDMGTSVFCKVLESNRGTGRPYSFKLGVVQGETKRSNTAGLSCPHDAAFDVLGISVAKRPEFLSVEVNLPRHFLTPLLILGALIVALVRHGKERAA